MNACCMYHNLSKKIPTTLIKRKELAHESISNEENQGLENYNVTERNTYMNILYNNV